MTTNININARKFRSYLAQMVRRANHHRATVHVDILDRISDDICSTDFNGVIEIGYDDNIVWIKCGNTIPVYFTAVSSVTAYSQAGNLFTICDKHKTVTVHAKS